MRATPSPMQGRARAGGFAAYYGTMLLRYGCTASQLHDGAPAQQGGEKRRAAPRVPAERGDAGRRCRAALEKVQAQQGGGFLPAFEAHAGPTPCSTLTGRWGQGATGGVVHLRDAQARHPTGHAAYLSHVSQAARRPGGRRTATAAAGEAGGLKTHHEMSGPVQRCRPHVTRRDELRGGACLTLTARATRRSCRPPKGRGSTPPPTGPLP